MTDNTSSYNEKTFLAILVYSDTLDLITYQKIFRCVLPAMISDFDCREAYRAFAETVEDNKEIVGTKSFVDKYKMIVQLEAPNFDIINLETYWAATATLKFWIKKIQDLYFNTRFKAAETEEDFQEVIKEKQLCSLDTSMKSISEDATNAIEEYENKMKSAIVTPYKSVNEVIGSLQGGDMVVLAGSSGGGKTCFMLNLAVGMAKAGKKVDIFSLEMPRYQLQTRIICSELGLNANAFRQFTLTEAEKQKYFEYANGEFKNLDIRIYNKQTVSIDEIRYTEMNSDADIVFIDYLGLINSYNSKSSYEKFSEISRNIKLIAMASNKPVIALHQLNRDFQNRDDKKPKTSDLRDSGKIEQDADMIWFVYRPYLFDEAHYAKEDIRFISAKNRHGEPNKEVQMVFNGKTQRISESIRRVV